MTGGEKADKNPIADIQADFSQVIQAFAMQALMACGKIMNPITRKYEKELPMARYHIGVIEVLQEKTEGNLSADEARMIEDVLHQVRMAFLDATNERAPEEAKPESEKAEAKP